MKKSSLYFGLILILVLATPLLVVGAGDGGKGKAVFTGKCASCHGPDGAGKEAIAKMLKTTMRPLGSKEVQAKTDAEVRKDISEGNGKMKPVKLTAEELANVIAYVRTLAKK